MATIPSEAPNSLISTGHYRILDMLCEGPIYRFTPKSGVQGDSPLAATYYDNVPVLNPDGSANYNVSGQGYQFGYTFGTPDQEIIAGFEKVESIIPISYNTRLANPPTGAGETKNVVASFNTDNYPDADSIRVTCRIPSLFTQDNDGNTNGYTVTFAIDISLNGGAFVEQSINGKVTGKCTSNFLVDFTLPLPKTNPASSRYEWKVRVRRASQNILSMKTQNETYVEAITVISNNSFNYPNTVLVGTYISANQFSSVPTRAYEVDGLLVKVPNGYTPTQYATDGTITAATYPAIWTGDFAGGDGTELLRNGDFSSSTGEWIVSNSISAFTVETSAPPAGESQYAQMVATTTDDWDMGIWQLNPSTDIVAGESYVVEGWYKTSGLNGYIECQFVSNTESFRLQAQTEWTHFTRTITCQNSQPWIMFRWFLDRGTQTGDTFYMAGLSVTADASGRKWTNNPAWIFYDLLTNKRYGLGKYIQENLVDKWTLYKISQYCDELVDDGDGGLEPRFTCNCAIQTRQDAYQLLQSFISVFQGMMYWADNRIMAVNTQDSDPICNFTNANVVDGKFTYSDTARNTRSTVVKVKWLNPDNFYKEQVELVEDIDGIARYGYVEKEITAFACTSRGQAIRTANWTLLTERYMTETITFQIGLDGNIVAPGMTFSVYDNFRKNSQQGGRIKSFDADRDAITLDREIYIRPDYTYTLSATTPKETYDVTDITGSDQIDFLTRAQIETRAVTNGSGYASVLTLDSGFSDSLYPGSIWLLSAIGTDNVLAVSQKYRCLATSEPSNGIIEVLGVEWNTGINYRVDTGYNILPLPVNSGDYSAILPPTNFTATFTSGAYVDNEVFTYLALDWDDSPSTNKSYYDVSGRFDNGAWFSVGLPTNSNFNFNIFEKGTYDFLVRAVSYGGQFSSTLSGQYVLGSNNPFNAPAAVSSVYISSGANSLLGAGNYIGREVEVSWTLPTGANGEISSQSTFVEGYTFHALDPNTSLDLIVPITQSGLDSTSLVLTPAIFDDIGRRDFNVVVQTFDADNVYNSGSPFYMNNASPTSGDEFSFFGVSGSLTYSISEDNRDTIDTTGVMFWWNTGQGFSPTINDYNYQTRRLSGVLNTSITGQYYVWYSLIDTYGITSDNVINGPYNALGLTVFGPSGAQGIPGVNGTDGTDGQQGNYVERRYLASLTVPSTPSGDDPSGWTVAMPSPLGTAIWASEAVKDVNGHVIGSWSTPQRISGNVIFYSNSQPSGSGLLDGDTWFDIDDDNKIYRYDGSSWNAAFVPFPKLDSNGNITNLVTTGDPSKPFQILASAFQVWNGVSAEAPFEIVSNVVYIKDAKIQSVAAGKITAGTISSQALVIAGGTNGLIRSDNYSAGTAGWKIDGSGVAEFNNVTIRGTVYATSGTFGGSIDIGSDENRTRITSDGFFQGTYVSLTGLYNGSTLLMGWTYPVEIKATSTAASIRIGPSSAGNVLIGESGLTITSDTNLYRTAADSLKTDDAFTVGGAFTSTGAAIFSSTVRIDGTALYFGSSSDTNLYRSSANLLKTDDSIEIAGTVYVGSSDTNLYRSAANVLKTDDAFYSVGNVTTDGYFAANSGMRKASSDGYTAPLYDGSTNISFRWNAGTSTLYVYDGSSEYEIAFVV